MLCTVSCSVNNVFNTILNGLTDKEGIKMAGPNVKTVCEIKIPGSSYRGS